uniref:Uncharacterized protein n=1 Tax=Zea mays TaxID=4577 RepID=A0A804LJD7_MAIZE
MGLVGCEPWSRNRQLHAGAHPVLQSTANRGESSIAALAGKILPLDSLQPSLDVALVGSKIVARVVRSGRCGNGAAVVAAGAGAISGCTALSIVKQGDLMAVTNGDDSRVVLGTTTDDGAITPFSSSST